jgi:hypothetical protein
LFAADLQKFLDDAHGFEDLEGAGVDDGGAVPVLRGGKSVDQVDRDIAACEFGGEEETGGTGAYD